MTKKEKIEIIKQLIKDIENTSDIEIYSNKRSLLFDEVINAGYSNDDIQLVIQNTNEWCKDFDLNMQAKIENQNLPYDKLFMELSKAGIINFINNYSILPD